MLNTYKKLIIGCIWIQLIVTPPIGAVDTLNVQSETHGTGTIFDTELSSKRIMSRQAPLRTHDGSLWWGLGIERRDLWGLLAEEGGVIRFDGTTWTRYTPADGLMDGGVLAIVQSTDGTLWFAGRHNRKAAVTRYDGTTWTIYSEEDGLVGDWIGKSVMIDARGHIWLAAQKKGLGGGYGVVRFDGHIWQNFTVADGLAHNRVFDMATDADGSVWVATSGGVSRYDGVDWITYTSENGLGGDGKVYSILVAQDGKVWCTHGEKIGVSVFDGKSWTYITKKEGLPLNRVRDMCETPDGTIWFGTVDNSKGLVCYRNGTWLRFTSQDGLPNESIYNIAQGPDGALWLTGFRLEIVRYQPDFNALKIVEGVLTQSDGLPQANIGIHILDDAGQVRAGTVTDENGRYRLSSFDEPHHVSLVVEPGFVSFKVIPIVVSALIAWLYFTLVWKILGQRHPNRSLAS